MSDWNFLNRYRVIFAGRHLTSEADRFNGAFMFPLAGEALKICVIASDGEGWQHVSVSFGRISRATPSWEIMNQVKDLFWESEDIVVQFHPPRSKWVNNHAGCLHLWRCTDGRETPVPPEILVGIKGITP